MPVTTQIFIVKLQLVVTTGTFLGLVDGLNVKTLGSGKSRQNPEARVLKTNIGVIAIIERQTV